MVQSGDANFDIDVLCPAGLASWRAAFAPPSPLPVPEYGAGPSAPRPGGRPGPLGSLGREARGAEGVAVLAAGRHRSGPLVIALEVLVVLAAAGVMAGLGIGGSQGRWSVDP
jgi:hypothetical protein